MSVSEQATSVKHTPGPWGLDAGPYQLPTVYAGHDLVPPDALLAPYVPIAEIRQDGSWDEAMANAALIAAAPELLAACVTAHHAMVKLGNALNWDPPVEQDFADAINAVRAARDKAEGLDR